MARGRTITNFGQAFTPLGMSGGVTAPVPPPPVPIPVPIVRVVGGMLPKRLREAWWKRFREIYFDEPEVQRIILAEAWTAEAVEQDDEDIMEIISFFD